MPSSHPDWRSRHEVGVDHHVGALHLKVGFALTAPWTVLFGPSGVGKTTVLRIIAGLDRPDAGRIASRSGDLQFVLTDTATRIFVPTHKRAIRMVAQRPALFPHLSAIKNIRYRFHATDAGERDRERLSAIVGLCRVGHLLDKMPAQLSGGERQRVALARAVAADDCRLLLLDEPFGGLEADLRDELIRDLRAWMAKAETAVLQVTHDLGEVFAAEAEVLKMADGKIVASGEAHDVLTKERQLLLERLAGHPR